MSILRHRGQHADRFPVRTRAVPPDDTSPIENVFLLEDPVTKTLPALDPAPAPRALPGPGPGPGKVPPLRPAPVPRHRAAWVPAPHPAPRAPVRITEPAALAGEVAAKWPGLFTVPCGGCHRVWTRGGTASFQALYVYAGQAGWRKDTLGAWACPACQARSGWRAPNTPVLAGESPECALARDVAAHAADVPVLDTFQRALRRPRYHLNVAALEAATPAGAEITDEENALAGDAA
jgi:hypothetical protein